MNKFIPGLKLAELFFHEVIHPILSEKIPNLIFSAAKLHRGSEVLGFDTPQSMDHDWGPAKLDIFLAENEYEIYNKKILDILSSSLPYEFRGYPTHFDKPHIDGGSLKLISHGPVTHRIGITTINGFFNFHIGINPLKGMKEIDWLLISTQYLRAIKSGKIFYDGLNELEKAKNNLSWYPDDIWLYLLACQWRKIDQEEPFMGRCGDVNDDLGSRIVSVRLIDEIMRLCFLMEREYWPYYKWFGTAFSRLKCAKTLLPIFNSILESKVWKEREKHLSSAYLYIAKMHNELKITEYIEPRISNFYTRPYKVPHSERFYNAIYSHISSPVVKKWPKHLGSVSQYGNSTDLLDRIKPCKKLYILYE